jgi:hypothetical protein
MHATALSTENSSTAEFRLGSHEESVTRPLHVRQLSTVRAVLPASISLHFSQKKFDLIYVEYGPSSAHEPVMPFAATSGIC